MSTFSIHLGGGEGGREGGEGGRERGREGREGGEEGRGIGKRDQILATCSILLGLAYIPVLISRFPEKRETG